jgi:hypothetical protein
MAVAADVGVEEQVSKAILFCIKQDVDTIIPEIHIYHRSQIFFSLHFLYIAVAGAGPSSNDAMRLLADFRFTSTCRRVKSLNLAPADPSRKDDGLAEIADRTK